jgi:hypothetical protein
MNKDLETGFDKSSGTSAYMKSCAKSNIPPVPVYIQHTGSEDELNLPNYHLSDSYVEALSEKIKFVEKKNLINLENASLSKVAFK